jgi:hypothetical protein
VHVCGVGAIVAMYLYFRRLDSDEHDDDSGGGRGPAGPDHGPDKPRPGTARFMPDEIRVFVPHNSEVAEREPPWVAEPAD